MTATTTMRWNLWLTIRRLGTAAAAAIVLTLSGPVPAEGAVTTLSTGSFKFELEIQVPPEQVWKAITEGEEIASWFAFQAKSEPGEGGRIWMSWDGRFSGSLPIRAWEPERRLVTGWTVTDPGQQTVELAVE